jgi:glyoxylase-like metal-dependent hydrolase (beta-lactamase superfamily II)
MRMRALIILSLLLGTVALPTLAAREPSGPATKVPPWNARGLGPLPWQGIACLDVNEDASRIALGTIAPPGDPNVLLLDGDGKVVRQQSAGQRWINQVALGADGAVRAICTMPAGRAGDMPELFRLTAEGVASEGINWRQGDYAQGYFHYGDHSNHVTRLLGRQGRFTSVVNGDEVQWLGAPKKATATFPLGATAMPVSVAGADNGLVVVGTTAAPAKDKTPPNLHVLHPSRSKPLWSRAVQTRADTAPRPEKGRYGTPTLSPSPPTPLPQGERGRGAGARQELPQRDDRVWAPLAVAVHTAAGQDAASAKYLVAAADYQGWQRWVRSSATGKDQDLGVRFMPSRPTITVYDQDGKQVASCAPQKFARPGWCDLRFSPDGKRLFIWPHSWTCRGLAGQTILPADDEANDLYVLEIASGRLTRLTFPDALADVALSARGAVVACWDGRLYLLAEDDMASSRIPAGVAVGGPGLVRVSRDGSRIVFAGSSGVVRLLDAAGKERWQVDLNRTVPRGLKPWVEKARAMPIGTGVWQLPGGRVESDLGGQRLIEAPDGLILIEAHAGLSFESEWAAIEAVGLDPRRVKYVLATHEHGDHAPGAYLWRVVTGAQFVCSEEMAYTLQHHVPLNSGYGFHPPVPTDVTVSEDTDLDLAGQKVRAVRIPGHTFGSMAWYFQKGGKSYLAFGDLIMPRGVLGYSGSINFSASDVLHSLRKLQALRPDVVLPGHGSVGGPADTLGAGVEVGVAGGWGLIRPEKPDPYFRITQKNVLVAAWNRGATSAAFGDVDGDGRPDIAIVSPLPSGERGQGEKKDEGALVGIFLNRGGRFAERPDHEIELPQVAQPSKVRILPAVKGGPADLFVGGHSAALLHADGKFPNYRVVRLDVGDGNQVRFLDVGGKRQTVVAGRFSGLHLLDESKGQGRLTPFQPETKGAYVDVRSADLNGDGRPDLITSYGQVYLCGADGKLPTEPTLRLQTEKGDWHFLAVGDFNGDRRLDVVLLSYGMHGRPAARVFTNRGKVDAPFDTRPDAVLPLDSAEKNAPASLLRDRPVVCDWDGDGIDDLVVGRGQSQEVLILLGGHAGLDAGRSRKIALDYRTHYETGLFVGDFNGDGRPDLAVFGYTLTGVGWNGPPAAYIWLQPAAAKTRSEP